MSEYEIDDLLALVEKPSRYLGTEINTVKKDFRKTRLRIVLAFPDLYEIGSSHFGIQILYDVLNRESEVLAERVFAPGLDMQAQLRAANRGLFSLETRHSVKQFDIVGFSLLTELNYTNVLNMLDLSGIQLLAAERGLEDPIVIAGGPCTSNPEPVAQFFDAMVIGDGEPVVVEMARSWLGWKESGAAGKEELLHRWAAIRGVYVPSFFDVYNDDEGFQRLVPKDSHYRQVIRSIVPSLDKLTFPTRPIVAFGRPVHDRLRLEIARGCSRGCRFCQAGMIYRPVRERSPETLLSLTEECVAGTGYEDMSLLSLSSGDYGCVIPLMERLMERHASDHLAVSLPSLRAGTLTSELMKLIKRVRKTGFTIAPEAGSQRLRDVINKNVSEDEIRETIKDAVGLGWRLIKLYFMIGLPTETEADLQALIGLVTSLQEVRGPKKERINLNVGIATFIPKPHTPFQWASQIPLAEAKRIMGWLKNRLNTSRIQVKWQNPEVSRIEAVLARGDRRLARVLLTAYRRGCLFDSWTDQFNYQLWRESFEECGVDPDFYTTRIRTKEEPLPWDHIDIQVTKAYLAKEWQEAVSGNLTPDCRQGECQGCGVCDFERITPEVYMSCLEPSTVAMPSLIRSDDRRQVVIDYSKRGEARYFGHLELVNIFSRAIRRTGIAVRYSEGFHPKPRISFDDPLPIGVESQSEVMYVQLEDGISMHVLKNRLNEQLPDGLVVNDCRILEERPKQPANKAVTYEITLSQGFFDDCRLRAFEESAEMMIVRSSAKGVLKRINLKEAVADVERLNGKHLRLKLVQEPGRTVRPAEFLQHVFELEEKDVKTARVLKVRNEKNTSSEMI
jgi:radical SAM family uncharacterized protein/radical SAM-linked protein